MTKRTNLEDSGGIPAEVVCDNKTCKQRGDYPLCYLIDGPSQCKLSREYKPQMVVPRSAHTHSKGINARAKLYGYIYRQEREGGL